IPDVMVANQGSNDVSLLLGGVDANGNYVLTSGPRMAAGQGPVSTALIPSATPRGPPSLAVADSGGNGVPILPGRGNGFFDTQAASTRFLPTGADPQQVMVGNFDTHGGLDLITVNAGSNNLTYVPNFLTASQTFSISSGGIDPTAAVAFDQ